MQVLSCGREFLLLSIVTYYIISHYLLCDVILCAWLHHLNPLFVLSLVYTAARLHRV